MSTEAECSLCGNNKPPLVFWGSSYMCVNAVACNQRLVDNNRAKWIKRGK